MPKEWFFEYIADHFWLIAILATLANYLSFRARSRESIKADPNLEEGYSQLLRGYLRWLVPPWIVMGAGQIFGKLSVFRYLFPSEHNPYVLIWYGTVIAFWILASFWIFRKGGAEILVKYPGALPCNLETPAGIRLYWAILSAVGIMLVTMIWTRWAPGM